MAAPFLVVLAAFCWGLSGGIGGILMGNGWDRMDRLRQGIGDVASGRVVTLAGAHERLGL